MKDTRSIRQGIAAVVFAQGLLLQGWTGSPAIAAGLVDPGDTLEATVFAGDAVGTPDGNPAADGQGWYRGDLTTRLNYYVQTEDHWVEGDPMWSTVESTGTSFSGVYRNASDQLVMLNYWSQRPGVTWIYSNQFSAATFEISTTRVGNSFWGRSRYVVKPYDTAEWAPLSDWLTGTHGSGHAYTHALGRGGMLGFQVGHRGGADHAFVTVDDLKVTLIEVLTEEPEVSLSATPMILPENPLQGSVELTATLSQLVNSDVTVNLVFSGSAVRDVDYACASQIVVKAGRPGASIPLVGLDNTTADGHKSLEVAIDSLTHAIPGSPSSVRLMLVDDETPPSEVGDTLRASVFMGTAVETTGGNPSPSGQAWYKRGISELTDGLLHYFTDDAPRWATVSDRTASAYAGLWHESPSRLDMTINYAGGRGIVWIFTNTMPSATYTLSCSQLVNGFYARSTFLARPNALAPWEELGPEIEWGTHEAVEHSVVLEAGGQLAYRVRHNNAGAAHTWANISDLMVTLTELPPRGTVVLVR